MEMGLRGRGALVAGASAGIGRAIARGLAAEGARVAMVARRPAVLEEAAREIAAETGSRTVPIVADLTDRPQARRCVEEATAAVGPLEVLVTNCGGPPAGRFLDLGPDDFARAFRLTFESALWLCYEAVPRMIETGRGGRIVLVASTAVKEPIEDLILSNSIRAGVAGLAKSLATELGPHRIRVNVLCPGFTATGRLEDLAARLAAARGTTPDAVREEWSAGTPLRRIGLPEEIADLAVFLASDRAAYVTGTVVAADGGRTRGLL
jgi:3-oxoacyl-[acyl-carrier protein] reductase